MQSHTSTHKGSTSTRMKRGILEVFLVHAEGMKHTNLIGTPVYYVVIKCGSHVHKSKTSSGKDEKTWWNEKFRIYLGGIIDEGINRGVLEMMPAPYNVVLEDDTYKGEIKIGLRFTANTEVLPERTFLAQVDEPRQLTCRSIINLWKFSWWKFWVYQNQRNTKNKVEEE
ncbi:C2 DOMAIN-CONTAINING [Salix viminalis]|uniref:C2 DOMAIN-CONTAINING n=1 Tax=Salix viminalis TaxID=40686 RepID=A0A9Q0NT45_SALVM|nr:C2 DOMAIN-CONTAINING [Salix viminalis]